MNKSTLIRWRYALKDKENAKSWESVRQLRNCHATVFETKKYYFLLSYDTFVAAIKKDTNECIDVLRYVYGYTSTSCQHIRKFFKDYTNKPYEYTEFYWHE